ncbi:hypothetical protein GXM_09192 [Nostoc sphaeroides CCNUC1]|uniref:Uncharacterized protein n=1 Tax=Nostoc sphaeroides CCNUC1 TaxID=2653204 RepID=A0A5P8WFZ3_9NOSO|nr:hypothetical protein GXM_09192 [Nostoc sphaeroides CCNUC1]
MEQSLKCFCIHLPFFILQLNCNSQGYFTLTQATGIKIS